MSGIYATNLYIAYDAHISDRDVNDPNTLSPRPNMMVRRDVVLFLKYQIIQY